MRQFKMPVKNLKANKMEEFDLLKVEISSPFKKDTSHQTVSFAILLMKIGSAV